MQNIKEETNTAKSYNPDTEEQNVLDYVKKRVE